MEYYDVILLPTAQCDRGCHFCSFDSRPTGSSVPFDKLYSLVQEMKELSGNLWVCVTGGGEPLLYPELPDLIEALLDIPGIDLSFVTSGCQSNEDTGAECLDKISRMKRKFRVRLSFNWLQPEICAKRLAYSLPLLRQIALETKVAFIENNQGLHRAQTIESEGTLGRTLRAMDYVNHPDHMDQNLLVGLSSEQRSHLLYSVWPTYKRSRSFLLDPKIEYGEEDLVVVSDHALGIERIHFKVGRGRSGQVHAGGPRGGRYSRILCASLDENIRDNFVQVSPSGEYFPCNAEGYPEIMRIGKIGEFPLLEAFESGKIIRREARRRAESIFVDDWCNCRRCDHVTE